VTALLSMHEVSRTLGTSGFRLDVTAIDLAPGACLAVVGPSGSGKSTLLGLLALALAPDRAAHFVLCPPDARGRPAAPDAVPIDLAALWRGGRREALAALRSRLIGFVPQTGGLLPFLSIGANIALPLAILGRDRDNGAGWPAGARTAALAAALGIGHLLARRPDQVSVGERQRASLARALIAAPALLLADEPTAALHPGQAAKAMALLVATATDTRAALVVATHDEPLARATGLAVARLVPDPDGQASSRFAWSGDTGRAAGAEP